MKWMKVSDRLPDKDGSYFIKLKNGKKDKFDLFLKTDSVRYWDDVEEWLDESEEEITSLEHKIEQLI